MALKKTGKRKIIVNNKVFYWYFGKDPRDRYCANAIHISSQNKDFLVIYRVDFVAEGSVFPKLEVIKSTDIEPAFYDLNQHVHERIVTPRLVSEIISFCLSGSKTKN